MARARKRATAQKQYTLELVYSRSGATAQRLFRRAVAPLRE